MARSRGRSAHPPILGFTPTTPDAPPVEVQRMGREHPMTRLGLHGHRFFELLYFTQGRGLHRVGARELEVREGDLVVLAPGELHEASGLREVQGFLLLFKAEALGLERSGAETFVPVPDELLLLSFLRPHGVESAHFQVPRPERTRWTERFLQLEEELEARRLGWSEAARALLNLLLIEAARLASPRLEGVEVSARPLLAQAFKVIEARYRQPISLADVARAVGRSPAYLTDLVRRQTGRSVLAWIIERRMAEARRRLVETEDDVADIAESVSYLDSGYFIRQFRKLHGVTPLQYRHQHR